MIKSICRVLATLVLTLLALPAQANDQAMLDEALSSARTLFAETRHSPDLRRFGVDLDAYASALALQPIANSVWDGIVQVTPEIRRKASGSCQSYAAFVVMPPEAQKLRLVLCPQFFSAGADDLRRLTILHEMVHAVAGRDECRAMAFAAAIEQAGLGRHTPVDRYWQVNDCRGSAFRLP